jgi:hypothetical protein
MCNILFIIDFIKFLLYQGPSQLPKGTKNIRSHLKNVDDVPLQVPMFVGNYLFIYLFIYYYHYYLLLDCTKESIKEMLTIMLENNEVVCVLGNPLLLDNISLFSVANAG